MKKRKEVIYIEYFFVWIITLIIRVLPYHLVIFFGSLLGKVAFYFIPCRRRITLENLALAFNQKKAKELKKISLSVWSNFGRGLFEFIKISYLPLEKIKKWIDFQGKEKIDQALKKQKGVILLTAHFGNWELTGAVIGLMGYPLSVVARPLDNPFLNRLLTRLRRKMKVNVITKRQAIRETLRCLKKNQIVGILIDQHFPDGVAIDFFGYPVLTTPLVSILVEKTQATVLPIYNIYKKNKIKIQVEDSCLFHFSKDKTKRKQQIISATQNLTKIIQSWIQDYPDHWFWMHDRWKRKYLS